jgi:hypothetical protein
MKLSFLSGLKFLGIFVLVLMSLTTIGNRNEKPAVIITQDGEVDDRSSFVRFLLYTPDMDLRGIVATNSKWQKNGHGLSWIYEAYDLYGQVRENLLLHNEDFPTVEFLKSITVLGNENPEHLTGDAPYADSDGSELIVRELLKIEDDLLHINCWGGVNTVAQALWKFKKNYPEKYKASVSKVRVITISFQDEAGDWIVNNMPEVRIINNNAFHMTWNYHNTEPLKHNPFPQMMSEKWLSENVKQNHGPLGEWYPQKNISEGDTPAFLNFADNGLEAWKDYSAGGWGGRYQPVRGNFWSDANDDNNMQKTLWRWIPDVQNDFAARMDWCVKSYEDANHSPVIEEVTVPGTVKPGQKVELKATASDPDGDKVYYWWWHYPDPSGMKEHIKIVHETSDNAWFTVPENSKNDIHIILEVSDDGSPQLKSYKRLIFKMER